MLNVRRYDSSRADLGGTVMTAVVINNRGVSTNCGRIKDRLGL